MTTFPVIYPKIPFVGLLPKPLEPGQMFIIKGCLDGSRDWCQIFLQSDFEPEPVAKVILILSIRPQQQVIVRNHYLNGWGPEEMDGGLPIGINDEFKIAILIRKNHFKITINDRHFCAFKHRLPLEEGKYIRIEKGCIIRSIRELQDNTVIDSIAHNESKLQELSEKVDEITALLSHQTSLNSEPPN